MSSTVHTCRKCTKSFPTAIALADHSRSTRHAISCTFPGCVRVFKSQQALEQHIKAFVHKDAQSNRLPKSAQQSHSPPTPKAPGKSKHTQGQSGASCISQGTVTVPVPTVAVAGPPSNNIYKRPSEATRGSGTHTVSLRQKEHNSINGDDRPSQPIAGTKLQSESHHQALTADENLHGWYTQSEIDKCYLVAIPRTGGAFLVSPIVVDCGGLAYDFAFLLPKPQQQAQLTTSIQSGSCKLCGFVFTSWESLTSHFSSSTCMRSSTRLSGERSKPTERASVDTNIPKPQSGIVSNTQVSRPQMKGRWSMIPEPQRNATLTTLAMSCHSHATLIKNKYTSGPRYPKALGIEVGPSLIPLPTPVHDPQIPKRSVVALDCEMIGVGKNESELARISVIDCLSGEVIIDTLVQPTRPVTNWRTKFSGITKKAMADAVVAARILKGWPEARAELWKHIDSDTIVIGQALYHDFDALRMQHWRVIDSAILAKDAVGTGVNRQWGLATLCMQLLGIEIQNHGNRGHDSVEDAFAAREVVLWCLGHQMELATWGRKQKEEYIRKKRELQAKRAKTSQQKSSVRRDQNDYTDSGEDEEILRWEDIAEDCGWPHPDTGYDPWSD